MINRYPPLSRNNRKCGRLLFARKIQTAKEISHLMGFQWWSSLKQPMRTLVVCARVSLRCATRDAYVSTKATFSSIAWTPSETVPNFGWRWPSARRRCVHILFIYFSRYLYFIQARTRTKGQKAILGAKRLFERKEKPGPWVKFYFFFGLIQQKTT